jgi:hypothetical protein
LVECRQGLQAWLRVTEIDLGLEERDFVIEPAFVDVDVPGPRPAIATAAPSVAASFELVLVSKGDSGWSLPAGSSVTEQTNQIAPSLGKRVEIRFGSNGGAASGAKRSLSGKN